MTDKSNKLIEIAAQMAMRKNMPDLEDVAYSSGVPKKTWRSLSRMFSKASQQCGDWAMEVRAEYDRQATIDAVTKASTGDYIKRSELLDAFNRWLNDDNAGTSSNSLLEVFNNLPSIVVNAQTNKDR